MKKISFYLSSAKKTVYPDGNVEVESKDGVTQYLPKTDWILTKEKDSYYVTAPDKPYMKLKVTDRRGPKAFVSISKKSTSEKIANKVSTKEIKEMYDDQIDRWRQVLSKERDIAIRHFDSAVKIVEKKYEIIWSQIYVDGPVMFLELALKNITKDQAPEIKKYLDMRLGGRKTYVIDSAVGYITGPVFRIEAFRYSTSYFRV